jgi:hypothetical protein
LPDCAANVLSAPTEVRATEQKAQQEATKRFLAQMRAQVIEGMRAMLKHLLSPKS